MIKKKILSKWLRMRMISSHQACSDKEHAVEDNENGLIVVCISDGSLLWTCLHLGLISN